MICVWIPAGEVEITETKRPVHAGLRQMTRQHRRKSFFFWSKAAGENPIQEKKKSEVHHTAAQC